MPRSSRLIVPGYPHHIIQRGHNRQTVFVSDEDYQYYLENLWEWKLKLGCRIYAYCLMTNHIHLIIDPGEDVENLGKLMKRLAGRQTRYVNKLEKRSGSLWEGRYKSSPISTDKYLLACCRYVELNPVRAGLVVSPAEYRWSSYAQKIGDSELLTIDYDPSYLGLSVDPKKRGALYAEWVSDNIPDGEWDQISLALQRGQLTGNQKFIDEIEKRTARRIEFRGPGRPRKHK